MLRGRAVYRDMRLAANSYGVFVSRSRRISCDLISDDLVSREPSDGKCAVTRPISPRPRPIRVEYVRLYWRIGCSQRRTGLLHGALTVTAVQIKEGQMSDLNHRLTYP